MKVVVVGARGRLGTAIAEEFSAHAEVIGVDRAGLDITNDRQVFETLTRLRPAAIINCTGYNDVDGAEKTPVAALEVNAFAVRSLARAARAAGATLVHYSSDFVFDGTATTPMTEDDPPNPRSAYATSKLLGEWFARDAPRWYVLRVESLFGAVQGTRVKGTVSVMVDAIASGDTPTVIADRTVSPTSILDAAAATRALLDRHAPFGLYHCVNSGHATWLQFATEAARLLGVAPRFKVVKFADVRLPAVRPQFCALSNEKLASAGFTMPTWQEALADYVRSVRVSTRSHG